MRTFGNKYRRSGARQRGFSLLEVLVAFTIACIALSVLFEIYGRGARAGSLSERYTRATLIADSLMAETGAAPLLPGVEEGVALKDYRWVREIREFEPDTAPKRRARRRALRHFALLEVAVNVSWENAGRERSVRLKSLRIGRLE